MKDYLRLPGRRRTLFLSRMSLWLGPDHILKVRTRGYTEEYRRFYYRDVQAIVFQRTSEVYGTGIVLLILMLIFGIFFAVGLSRGWESGWLWAAGIPGLLFLLLLGVHLMKGPTCRCYIRTAVQTEPLESLNRVRTAVAAIHRVRERVEAAQGTINREELFRLGQPAE